MIRRLSTYLDTRPKTAMLLGTLVAFVILALKGSLK